MKLSKSCENCAYTTPSTEASACTCLITKSAFNGLNTSKLASTKLSSRAERGIETETLTMMGFEAIAAMLVAKWTPSRAGCNEP